MAVLGTKLGFPPLPDVVRQQAPRPAEQGRVPGDNNTVRPARLRPPHRTQTKRARATNGAGQKKG